MIINDLLLLLILGGVFVVVLGFFKHLAKHRFGQATQLVNDDVPDYIKSPEFILWDITWHCSILQKPNSAEYVV